MKTRLAASVAAAFVLSQVAIVPFAYAEEAAAPFRSAAQQHFTADELQQYGLSGEAADRAEALQNEGYEIRVLSQEEADQYTAGISDNQWLLLGILAGVIVIAVAVTD